MLTDTKNNQKHNNIKPKHYISFRLEPKVYNINLCNHILNAKYTKYSIIMILWS